MRKRKFRNEPELSNEDFQSVYDALTEEDTSDPIKLKKKASSTESPETASFYPRSNRLPPVLVSPRIKPLPNRKSNGTLFFKDFPEFLPNLVPKEIFQRGSFGGTCFRPITSGVTGHKYSQAWLEYPPDWFEGLEQGIHYASLEFRKDVNYYKVACGSDMKAWEDNGWIADVDPYGWFQWYCRFYLGRRCSDDHRQISRAIAFMGSNGRWRQNLINKCLASGKPIEEAVNDMSISPKTRQSLQVRSFLF
jgi:hypothetical protein